MNTSEMELPRHIYTESPSPCGTMTRVTISPDLLINWAEDGRGDAITRLCHEVCEKKLDAIDSWESHRILELEDEYIAADNDEEMDCATDEDEDDDAHVQCYHAACEAVTREAEMKRTRAREQMGEHRSAVETLVKEAREFIAAHEPPPQEDHLIGYMLTIGAVLAVGYVLFN
jgi:hypothetical protein